MKGRKSRLSHETGHEWKIIPVDIVFSVQMPQNL